MSTSKRCPTCGAARFHAQATVRQTWLMDADGTRLSVLDPDAETVCPPSDDGPWTCAGCGHTAPGREFDADAPGNRTLSPRAAALSGLIAARGQKHKRRAAEQAVADRTETKRLVDGILADDVQDQILEILVLANQARDAGIEVDRFRSSASPTHIGIATAQNAPGFSCVRIQNPSRGAAGLEVAKGIVRGFRTDDSDGHVSTVYCEPGIGMLRQFRSEWPVFRELVLTYLEKACQDGR